MYPWKLTVSKVAEFTTLTSLATLLLKVRPWLEFWKAMSQEMRTLFGKYYSFI